MIGYDNKWAILGYIFLTAYFKPKEKFKKIKKINLDNNIKQNNLPIIYLILFQFVLKSNRLLFLKPPVKLFLQSLHILMAPRFEQFEKDD